MPEETHFSLTIEAKGDENSPELEWDPALQEKYKILTKKFRRILYWKIASNFVEIFLRNSMQKFHPSALKVLT